MKIFRENLLKLPVGIWLAFLALSMISLAWIMQAYSLINWEGAVKLGLQDDSFTGGLTEQAMADVERGVAVADILWALPLTLIAFIGLVKKKFIGLVAAMMVFAVCIYFPLFYAFRESASSEIVLGVIFLWAVPSLIGIIGLWSNRSLFISKS